MNPDTPRTPETTRPDPVDEPLASVIAGREERDPVGHDGQFQAAEAGSIRCLTCRQVFPASTLRADDVDRLEGASDPADQSMVVPVTCPSCAARGTLIVRYGPEASADEADLLVDLRRVPADRGRPPAPRAEESGAARP